MNDSDIEVTFPDGGVYGVTYPDDWEETTSEAWTWNVLRSSSNDKENLAIIKANPYGAWAFGTIGPAGEPVALVALAALIQEHDVKVKINIADLFSRIRKKKQNLADMGAIE